MHKPRLWRVSHESGDVVAASAVLGMQEEAERSAASAEALAGKPGELSTQPSFDIVAFAGTAAAASLATQPEREQPGRATRAVPCSGPAAAVALPPPTDALFARWQRIVLPVQPSAAHQGVRSHPVSYDSDCEAE